MDKGTSTPSSPDDGNQIEEITKMFTDPYTKFSRTQTFNSSGPNPDKRGVLKKRSDLSPDNTGIKENKQILESEETRRVSIFSGRSAKGQSPKRTQVQMDLARLKMKKTEVAASDSMENSPVSIEVISEKDGEDGSDVPSQSQHKSRIKGDGKTAARKRASSKRGTLGLSVNVGYTYKD